MFTVVMSHTLLAGVNATNQITQEEVSLSIGTEISSWIPPEGEVLTHWFVAMSEGQVTPFRSATLTAGEIV